MPRDRSPKFIVKLRYRNERGVVTEISDYRVLALDALTAVGHLMAREDCPPQEQLWQISSTHFMEDV